MKTTHIQKPANIKRRGFLKVSGMVGAGFSLASYLPAPYLQAAESGTSGQLELNAFVEVGTDGAISLYAHTPEKGQGIKTSLPMVIAEELGANWDDVTVIRAPMNEARYGLQRAGGSTSTPREFDPMRRAGPPPELCSSLPRQKDCPLSQPCFTPRIARSFIVKAVTASPLPIWSWTPPWKQFPMSTL